MDEPVAKKPKGEWPEEDEDFTQLAPDEIWLDILGYLSQEDKLSLMQASKRFNNLCKDSSVWRSLQLDFEFVQRSARAVSAFVEQLTALEKITVTNRTYEKYPEASLMATVLRTKETLKHLDVSAEVVLSNESLSKLSQLPHLETLDFSADKLKDSGLKAISTLSKLRELRMPNNEIIPPKVLRNFFEETGNLELLDLSDCRKGVLNQVVACMAAKNPKLRHLVLDDCELITGNAIKAVADHCPLLEHLSLEGCYLVNDASVVRLATSCKHLRFISLGLTGTAVKDSGVRALAASCPNLQHLNLFGCSFVTEKGLKFLLETAVNLRYLQIQSVFGISAQFITNAQELYPHVEIDFYQKKNSRRDRGKKY